MRTSNGVKAFRMVPPSAPALFESYGDLLTVADLCEITGLSAQTIRKEIGAGRLPGCRIGRRLYVAKSELNDFVLSRESRKG